MSHTRDERPELCSLKAIKFSLINGYLGYLLTAQGKYSWKFHNKTTLASSPVAQINVFNAIRNL